MQTMTEERKKAKVVANYDGCYPTRISFLDNYVNSLDWLQPVAVKVMMQCIAIYDASRQSDVCTNAKRFAHHVHVGLLTIRPMGEVRYLDLLDAVCEAIHFVELHKDLVC